MGLPTWSPKEVSTFFVKSEADGGEGEMHDNPPEHRVKPYLKKMEVPGLAFVSVFVILTRVTGRLWNMSMSRVPKDTKAMVRRKRNSQVVFSRALTECF